jgi:hypothetical protein
LPIVKHGLLTVAHGGECFLSFFFGGGTTKKLRERTRQGSLCANCVVQKTHTRAFNGRR